MKNRMKKTYPTIAEEGLQHYIENVTRRYELTDRILQGIREGNEYQALRAVQARNNMKMPGRLNDELTEWKYDVIQLKSLIIQELRRLGVIDLLLDGVHTEFTRKAYEASSVEECKQISEEMAIRFCRMNHLKSIHNYSVLVQKIILAVDMDLSQGLTLQYFSESLNVNRSYLSNLFRREVGMTITDYVTDRRIQSAADLLLTTQYPIKTVAKQVGIMDVHYFSRLFKKKMGKPPSKYREERG
ncbi:MAG: helix-turn-helix domain-containing protein [Lachnospiraceae bacterium]|nr:helix-turn-helix domain-containing protein [Lachnospiraceae bacterium]